MTKNIKSTKLWPAIFVLFDKQTDFKVNVYTLLLYTYEIIFKRQNTNIVFNSEY